MYSKPKTLLLVLLKQEQDMINTAIIQCHQKQRAIKHEDLNNAQNEPDC